MGPLLSLLKKRSLMKPFFAELGRALLLGGDVRVEGAARVAADREHVHHGLLLALHPSLSDAGGWGREVRERRSPPHAGGPGAHPLGCARGPGPGAPETATPPRP